LIDGRHAANLEEAFIGYMEDSMAAVAAQTAGKTEGAAHAPEPAATAAAEAPSQAKPSGMRLRLGRLLAYTNNETAQILRDPVGLMFAFLGSALLMLVFGFGITTDVEHIRYTTLDQNQSPESRAYLEQFAGAPRYFTGRPPARSADDALKRMQ